MAASSDYRPNIDPALREADASRLLRIGLSQDVSQLPLLKAALHQPQWRLRSSAAWALGFFEDPESTELLFDCLEDPDFQVRSSAGWGLVRRGRSLLPRLRRHYHRTDGDQQEMVSMVIDRLEMPAPHGLVPMGTRQTPRPKLKSKPHSAMSDANFATVVHDLRNLSAAVGLAAEAVAEGDSEASQEVTDLVQTFQLVCGELLDSRRGLEAGTLCEVDLPSYIKKVCAQAQPILRSYELQCHTEVDAVTATFDSHLAQRALLNLLWNAAKHATGSTAVWVGAQAHDGQLRLTVEDDGPGLAPGRAAQLKRAFMRGEGRSTEGWGLGLYLVHEASKALGGHLEIGNSPRGGARFCVSIALRSRLRA